MHKPRITKIGQGVEVRAHYPTLKIVRRLGFVQKLSNLNLSKEKDHGFGTGDFHAAEADLIVRFSGSE